ncbi:unnamed protein product [Ceutorhynchus assimilis]|uniref:DUF7869 domain-containing protein n=1 Tax=Ceutorhynchus assimilis TaxID=467358 RepID=A0A9N9MFS6_9CUCU|nr:unnamed protein product [Ceutorhynchus assimilis]
MDENEENISDSEDTATDTDPYETDEDSEYLPNSPNRIVEAGTDDTESETSNNEEHVTPRKARKRKRNENQKQKRKRARLTGQQYVALNGKEIRKRELKPYNHRCRYGCDKIEEERRKLLFEKFYSLQSYDLQTQYLASCITKSAPKRPNRNAVSQKQFTTIITLMGTRVCKKFFLKTFDITNRRFGIVCQKKNADGFTDTDKRGHHAPKNKIDAVTRNNVITHIKMFPRYKSHYSQSQNGNTSYLPEDLCIRKMYSLYKIWCNETKNIPPVKESYYRSVFCNEFNLKFHKPHSDTCHTCDRLNNLINNSPDENIKTQSKAELELHQRKVESVKNVKKLDKEYGRQNPDKVRVICFDLQKTLPTPFLSTNKVFYLRQLWTYNLCIHDLVTGISSMYIWDETIGQRGSQEIGSCLIKYIMTLPPNIEELICYSDQCGGQNKNKNITKLFMFLVQTTSLKIIHHKFFESGHSYMECDRSFARIEKAKKKALNIFIPKNWSELIRNTSNKFQVIDMKQEDFLSFDYLNSIITDPKKDMEKKPLKWRQIVWFTYRNEDFFCFLFNQTRNPIFPSIHSQKCSALPVGRPKLSIKKLLEKSLYSTTLKIKKAKWENLIQLLPYIPPIYHDFYQKMPHEAKVSNKKTKGKPSGSKKNETQNKAEKETQNETEEETQNETDQEDDVVLSDDYEEY